MGLGICGGFGAAALVEAARVVLRVEDEGEVEEDWRKADCGMESEEEEEEKTARRCWGRRSGFKLAIL